MKDESNKSFDLNELKAVSNGDEQFVSEMIGVFIKITQEGIEEMELALKGKKNKIISDCIHKIAPPCRHMGAFKLLSIFTEIKSTIENSGAGDNLEGLIEQAKQEINTITEGLRTEIGNN